MLNLKLTKIDKICLGIVLIFSLFCTIKMMLFSMSGCILNPDVALYSLSALKYAGLDYFNVAYPEDLFFTPIISFLTSLFFRVGYVDKNAIIFITSFFSFFGYVGVYVLLKNRFNSILSLTGVIIYGSLSIVILNISKGMIDIPAISISIWALIFGILAINKNPKYFLISLPLLVIGFFTKYIAGFILPLLLFYYLLNRNIVDLFDDLISDKKLFKTKVNNYIVSKEFKYLIISIVISIMLIIIICKTLILDFGGSLTFFEQSTNTFNGYVYPTSGIDYNIDKSYYFDNFADIIFEARAYNTLLSTLLYGIFGVGLLLNLIRFIKNKNEFLLEKNTFKTYHLKKILLYFGILLIIFSFLILIYIPNHMVANICLLIAFTLLFSILDKYNFNHEKLAFDFLFLVYFIINFIFISLFATKVPRYALPIIPAFIYLIVWGWDSIITFAKKISFSNFKISSVLSISLIIIFLLVTSSFIVPMQYERSNDLHIDVNYRGYKNDLVDACDFIVNNNSNYHNKSFTSYNHHSRIIRWYLNVNVSVVDYNDPLTNYNETDYIILNENKTLNNYKLIYNPGDFYIYYKINMSHFSD